MRMTHADLAVFVPLAALRAVYLGQRSNNSFIHWQGAFSLSALSFAACIACCPAEAASQIGIRPPLSLTPSCSARGATLRVKLDVVLKGAPKQGGTLQNIKVQNNNFAVVRRAREILAQRLAAREDARLFNRRRVRNGDLAAFGQAANELDFANLEAISSSLLYFGRLAWGHGDNWGSGAVQLQDQPKGYLEGAISYLDAVAEVESASNLNERRVIALEVTIRRLEHWDGIRPRSTLNAPKDDAEMWAAINLLRNYGLSSSAEAVDDARRRASELGAGFDFQRYGRAFPEAIRSLRQAWRVVRTQPQAGAPPIHSAHWGPNVGTPERELRAIRSACRAEIGLSCRGVAPGGGRLSRCVIANVQMSSDCKDILTAIYQYHADEVSDTLDEKQFLNLCSEAQRNIFTQELERFGCMHDDDDDAIYGAVCISDHALNLSLVCRSLVEFFKQTVGMLP